MRRSFPPLLLAAGLYLLLALALTWPLLLHMGTHVPNDLGDALLNVYLLAWNARELPLTERWWNLPQFYPAPGAMAFSEHLLGLSALTTPVIALTGNALLGYNAAFLLSFVLCGLAAHLLAFELTRRHDLALVAGVAFAFAPYRMSQLAHVQVLSSYWMPLTLLGLHRFMRLGQWRWLALAAGSWYLQALACGYYLFYLSVLVAAWILWFAVSRTSWQQLARIGLAWTAAGAAMAPFALGYLKHQGAYGFARGREEIESYSADLASVLSAPGNLLVWGGLRVLDRPEATLFPGLTLVALVATGGALCWRAVRRADRVQLHTARVLTAVASVFVIVAATPVWFGPWRIEVAGARLLSVGTAGKPLVIALLLGCVALALHPAGRTAWCRRSPLAFYAAAAGLMWLLSLGPAPTLFGAPLFEAASPPYAPYAWLMMLPGVDGVRVPARFWTLATLCLAVAGSLATAHVAAHGPRIRWALPLLVAALVTLEGWPAPVRLWTAPAPRPAGPEAVARLEIPMGPVHDVVALYRAARHARPVFNGYSGYFPPHYGVLMNLIAGRDADVLGRLASVGPVEVLVDHVNDESGAWRDFVSSHPGSRIAARSADYTLYEIPATAPAPDLAGLRGRQLPVSRIEASVHAEDVELMIDGDLATRWQTGPQAPDNEIVIDLGDVCRVDLVELRLGGFEADFPRRLVIDLSTDGEEWSTAWSGRTAAHALWAAIEDPRTLPLRFPLAGVDARYIRLRQTAADPVYYWSIAELGVYGS